MSKNTPIKVTVPLDLVVRCAMADRIDVMAAKCNVPKHKVAYWRDHYYNKELSEAQKAIIYYHYREEVEQLLNPNTDAKNRQTAKDHG